LHRVFHDSIKDRTAVHKGRDGYAQSIQILFDRKRIRFRTDDRIIAGKYDLKQVLLKAVNVALAGRTRGLASCNKIPSAINDSVMPYMLRLYLCLFVVGFVAFVLADWLSPLGPLVNAVLAAVAAYLTILIGRRVLGRKNL